MDHSSAELANTYPSKLSNDTVLQQVRRNIFDEVLGKAPTHPRAAHELVNFITLEPINITTDDALRIANLNLPGIVVGNFPSLQFASHNPKPILVNRSPKELRLYFRRYVRYRMVHMLSRYLSNSISFTTQMRVFPMTHSKTEGGAR